MATQMQLTISLSDKQLEAIKHYAHKDDDDVEEFLVCLLFEEIDDCVECLTLEKSEAYMKAAYPHRDLVRGDEWHCPDSPNGVCWYDHEDDSCHDQCIFCGEPEERK